MRVAQSRLIITVHLPPRSVAEVYVGFVFGKASNVRRPEGPWSPNASSSSPCFSKEPFMVVSVGSNGAAGRCYLFSDI